MSLFTIQPSSIWPHNLPHRAVWTSHGSDWQMPFARSLRLFRFQVRSLLDNHISHNQRRNANNNVNPPRTIINKTIPPPIRLSILSSSRSEEHTSELQSHHDLVCRLLLEKKKKI